MTAKMPAMIAVLLTIVILIVYAVISIFFQMVALNAVSERQGVTAMGISLVCQGVVMLLMGAFAGWLTNLLITRFSWNQVLAVVVTVLAAALVGMVISFVSIGIAIPLAGIR